MLVELIQTKDLDNLGLVCATPCIAKWRVDVLSWMPSRRFPDKQKYEDWSQVVWEKILRRSRVRVAGHSHDAIYNLNVLLLPVQEFEDEKT